jgi:hypothetical protein
MSLFPRRLRFWTALAVVTHSLALQAAPAAAGLAPSRLSGATATIASSREADLVVVQRMLENRVVAQKLRDYGVSPDEARLRVASLSDDDLHTLASASKGLPSGGDALGTVIALLVIVVLVIVILKLMNKQIIVK